MGEGSCIDDERREFDAYYTNIDNHLDMTAARCAQLCTEQPLCIGLGWNEIIFECENLFPNGQAENIKFQKTRIYFFLLLHPQRLKKHELEFYCMLQKLKKHKSNFCKLKKDF